MANEPGKGQHEQGKGQDEQGKGSQVGPKHRAPVQQNVLVQTEQGPDSQDQQRKGVQQEAGKGAQHKEKAGHGGR